VSLFKSQHGGCEGGKDVNRELKEMQRCGGWEILYTMWLYSPAKSERDWKSFLSVGCKDSANHILDGFTVRSLHLSSLSYA